MHLHVARMVKGEVCVVSDIANIRQRANKQAFRQVENKPSG